MENDNGHVDFHIPESGFWSSYSTLKEKIKALKRKNVPFEKYDPLKICWEIETILNRDEEENLSFLPNKIRKLSAGSELCKDVCVLQRHFSSLEINKAVSEVLEEEKHEKIAHRILSRQALQAKREKFFLKQALDRIINSLGDETDEEEVALAKDSQRQPGEKRESSPEIEPNLDVTQPETARARASEIGRHEDFRMSEMEMTTQRMTEVPQPLEDVSLLETEARILLQENNLNSKPQEEVLSSEIPPPLEDLIVVADDLVPETILEEDLESLPPVTTPPKKQIRVRPAFDRFIVIPGYVGRARRLNESIVIERVQVFEGPPSIIQAFTVRHLMETSGVIRGFHSVRSGGKTSFGFAPLGIMPLKVHINGVLYIIVLERLFKRHLKTEKMLDKDVDFPPARETTLQGDARQAWHSEAPKSSQLDVSLINSNLLRESTTRQDMVIEEQLERLIGTPLSKILQRNIPHPEVQIGPSDPWLPPRAPRIRNLQGTTVEPPIGEPWFQPIPQPAPDDKWREFKLVRTRLDEVWMKNHPEKKATLREILHKEGEWTKENMLTVLRIVDKMSLKREVLVNGYGENIVIHPFEIPYVTEKQYSLRGQPPKF